MRIDTRCGRRTLDGTKNFTDFAHLVALEWQRLLAVHFSLVAFEDRAKREQLRIDTTYRPYI